MTTAIVKFNKDTLTEVGRKGLFVENSWGLTISQFYDVEKPGSYNLSFAISVAEEHAPYIEEEMAVVIREKVDLAAIGPNDVLIKNIGKDDGGENYINKKPYRPKGLPPGFEEALKL